MAHATKVIRDRIALILETLDTTGANNLTLQGPIFQRKSGDGKLEDARGTQDPTSATRVFEIVPPSYSPPGSLMGLEAVQIEDMMRIRVRYVVGTNQGQDPTLLDYVACDRITISHAMSAPEEFGATQWCVGTTVVGWPVPRTYSPVLEISREVSILEIDLDLKYFTGP